MTKSNGPRLAKQQLCTCITLFVYFLSVVARLQSESASFHVLSRTGTQNNNFRIQLQKRCQHLTNQTRCNKRDKVWSSGNSHFKWRFRSRRRCYCLSSLLGTLRSDDGDGNEYVKKAIGLITKTTTLRLHHAFLYMPLPSLHDFDVKMPDFTFYRGSTQETTKFPLCFWTWIWFSGIQL